MLKNTLLLPLLFTLSAGIAHAEYTGTLKKIHDANRITVGYRESSVPFSYLDAHGKPTGYAFEICQAITNKVKTRLNLPNLKIKYQPISSANRIALLQNGTIDIECGSTTNSKVRQKQAAFGISYVGVQVSAAVRKADNIKDLKDLHQKNIALTSGTTSVALVKNYEKTHGVKFRLLMTKDFAEAMNLVANGRADAFVIDDVLLAGQIATLSNPQDFRILDMSLSKEPYGPMFRKDDPAFKKIVDETMMDLIQTGRLEKLYNKWFTQPIPPKNINLNFPMNKATRDLFLNPNSEGI